MPFYYRTKTGIPGLYYTSGRGRSDTAFVIMLFFGVITLIIIFCWLTYFIFKYAFIGCKYLFFAARNYYLINLKKH